MNTDICIIGAGPAGATTALYLAKMGISHLIVDAAEFPRDKVCGDGLDLKVLRVLHDLEPQLATEVLAADPQFARAWGARIITPNGRATDFWQRPATTQARFPLYWVAKRQHFDHFLVRRFDRRYTDFRPGVRVRHLEQQPDGTWHVAATQGGQPLDIRAKLVIGADGEHSTVLRSLGQRGIDRRHYAAAQRQYWRGIGGFHADGLIEFYFPPRLPWAYFWMFPLPHDEANVGLIVLSEPAARQKINIRAELQRIICEDPVIAPRFVGAEPLEKPVGWGLPMSSLRRPAAGRGYLLVGDAASLISPVTGEGIGTSMFSGCVAAHFAKKALELGRFEADVFANYDHEVYRLMEPEIRLAWFFRKLYAMPWGIAEWAMNRVLPSWVTRRAFHFLSKKWLETAFEKPIRVRV
jgi:menaquinone-9 beta-reductase